VAPLGGGVSRITPSLAEDAGIWTSHQRQDDRQDSCSEHVKLILRYGKSRATVRPNSCGEIGRILINNPACQGGLRDFATEVSRIPQWTRPDLEDRVHREDQRIVILESRSTPMKLVREVACKPSDK
jgi:hypothetical protein